MEAARQGEFCRTVGEICRTVGEICRTLEEIRHNIKTSKWASLANRATISPSAQLHNEKEDNC